MITIKDDDTPIVAAEKIIYGVRKNDLRDQFDIDDIKELAEYLLLYYKIHKDND